MRLQHLDIQGFGRLAGRIDLEVGAGSVALLVARNEAGKSTLAQAILGSLYGLDGRRTRTVLSRRDRHRPWNHDKFGTRLLVSLPEEDLLIERDFDDGSVRVVSGAQDVTDRFQNGRRVRVGHGLTGLTREQFELSFFMKQGGLVWTDPSQLSDALQRAADTQTGTTTAAKAIEVLSRGLAEYDGVTLRDRGQVVTEIQRCEERLAQAKESLQSLENQRVEWTEHLDMVRTAEQDQVARERQRRQLRCRHAHTRAFELQESLERDRELGEEALRLEARAAELSVHPEITPEGVHQLELRRREVATQEGLAEHAGHLAAEAARLNVAAAQERDAFGLHRAPTEDDVRGLMRAVDRLAEVETTRQDLQGQIAVERADLAARGLTVEEGLALATALDELDEPDRKRLDTHQTTHSILAQRRRELREQIDEVKRERARIRYGQQVAKHFGIWCLLVGMLPVLVAISTHSILPFSPWFLYGPGLGIVALGIVVFLTGARWRAGDAARRKAELQGLRAREREMADADEVTRAHWERIAKVMGLDPPELSEAFERYRMAEPQLENLRWLRHRQEEQDAMAAQTMSQLGELWTLLGRAPEPERLAEDLEHIQAAYAAAGRADEAASHAAATSRRVEEFRSGARRIERGLRDQLRSLGITLDPEDSLDRGFERLQAALTSTRERQRLLEQRLPELRDRLLSAERAQWLRAQQSEWAQQADRLRRELADEGVDATTLQQALSQREYDDALSELDITDTQARQEEIDLRTSARTFLARYEAEAPVLRETIERLRAALRRARAFNEAVKLARDTMSELARDTHRDWAAALNQRARVYLRDMNTEVTDVHFDERLGLRVQHSDRVLTATEATQQLSAGALDAVYLASRLAVADYLHPHLPVVLDDPFANVDDQRLLGALRLLVDVVAPRRQVLLLACQASRYRWALEQLGHPRRIAELHVPTARESMGP